MIHLDVMQGSKEWFAARAGVPTASEFDRILTPSTLKLSKQADGYLHRLLAEWMTGQVFETETRVWAMDQGIEREEEAVQYFELTTGKTTRLAGFCLTDDRQVGASPDRFVDDDELLEVKAPLASTHVGYLLGEALPLDYVLQVQGQLFVTQKQACYFLSYYPALPPLLLRIEPDPTYQHAIAVALRVFCLRLEDGKRKLETLR